MEHKNPETTNNVIHRSGDAVRIEMDDHLSPLGDH